MKEELSAKLTEVLRAKPEQKIIVENGEFMSKDYSFTKYNKTLLANSRNLRNNMTKHERHLWYDFLKDYDVPFARQRIIGDYIVDFYCHKANLAVELDGSQHYTDSNQVYDIKRSDVLRSYGITVIRFTNRDIDTHFDDVCNEIDRIVRNNINIDES